MRNAASGSPAPHDGSARATRALALAPLELAGAFTWDDFRLEYTEYGRGDKVVVLTHGLLMTRRLHRELARRLAREGFRVITLDLLGHGGSDRPEESWRYSMTDCAAQVVALLDHLGIDKAVVGGTSLGANVSLEVAVLAPERLSGLLVEMPVLDNAIFAGLIAFPPLLFAGRFVPITVRTVARLAAMVPQGNQWIDVVTDTLRQEPLAMAAVLHGLLFGRLAPPRRLRQQIETPTLVIGHAKDPIHPFGDADALAADLPDARFVKASSPVELRFRPERLTETIITFLRERFDAAGTAVAAGA